RMVSTAATKEAPRPSAIAALSAARPSRPVSSVRRAEATYGCADDSRALTPAEPFFVLIFAFMLNHADEVRRCPRRNDHFFSQAANASAKARSPGVPFSSARIARPPLV